MLKGSNKTKYQREYMKLKRARDVTPYGKGVTFVMPNLPPERTEAIKGILEQRKILGCPDDSKARWRRALDYRAWELV